MNTVTEYTIYDVLEIFKGRRPFMCMFCNKIKVYYDKKTHDGKCKNCGEWQTKTETPVKTFKQGDLFIKITKKCPNCNQVFTGKTYFCDKCLDEKVEKQKQYLIDIGLQIPDPKFPPGDPLRKSRDNPLVPIALKYNVKVNPLINIKKIKEKMKNAKRKK